MRINLKFWLNNFSCPLVFYVAREKSKAIFLLFCNWPNFPIVGLTGFLSFL